MSEVTESVWQVQEAKNRFSELIEQAIKDGPQTVTRHGKPVVTVSSIADSRVARGFDKDDGFAAHLLSVMQIVKDSDVDGLELPVRRSRKRSIELGE